MPGGTSKEGNVDGTEGIIDGLDQECISRKEESRQCESRILGQANLVGRSMKFHERCPTNEPFGHGRPEMDRKWTCVGYNKHRKERRGRGGVGGPKMSKRHNLTVNKTSTSWNGCTYRLPRRRRLPSPPQTKRFVPEALPPLPRLSQLHRSQLWSSSP